MQTQDAPAEILFKLWPWLEANAKALIIGAVLIIVLVGGYFFVQTQHEQNEINAGEALTTLMANPPGGSPESSAAALTQLASKYAGTQAAVRAQLQGAAMFYSLGDYTNAETEFEKFLSSNSGGQQAAMAQLGLATSLEAEGKQDAAVAAYQKVVSGYPSSPCAVPANYALGRILESQGKLSAALPYYSAIAQVGQEAGSYGQLAAQAANQIQAKLAAQKPASSTTTVPSTIIPSLTPISK
jgi:predicted negative regulator of RcsB-dependent stress response